MLYKNGKRENKLVNRLVAEAFIPNPENKPEVNHIDGNPLNNFVTNLEWATKAENMKHAYINNLNNLKQYNESNMKPVIRSDGKIYKNTYEASKDLNLSVCSIRGALKGRSKTSGGYAWRYLDEK